jgi:hypothetical protein
VAVFRQRLKKTIDKNQANNVRIYSVIGEMVHIVEDVRGEEEEEKKEEEEKNEEAFEE